MRGDLVLYVGVVLRCRCARCLLENIAIKNTFSFRFGFFEDLQVVWARFGSCLFLQMAGISWLIMHFGS